MDPQGPAAPTQPTLSWKLFLPVGEGVTQTLNESGSDPRQTITLVRYRWMILDGWIWRDGRMVRNKSSCDAVKSGRDALTLLQYGVHSLAALQPLAILQPRRFAGLSLWPCEKGAGGHFPLDLPKLWTKTEPKKKGITLFVGLRLKSSSPLGASRWVPGWMEEQQHRGEQKPLGNQTGVHRVYSTSNSPW